MPSSVLLRIASSDDTTIAARRARWSAASASTGFSTNVLTAAVVSPFASVMGVAVTQVSECGPVMPVDNNRDIANGLAGANRLRGGAALHIRRGGRPAPQVNRALIEPNDATVAIGDADRHRQGIERLRVERIDGEIGFTI